MPRNYEFVSFPDGKGEVRETREFEETVQAKGYAGRLSKKIRGPVDIAFVNSQEWDARYITTAMPSIHHASGYCFERMD